MKATSMPNSVKSLGYIKCTAREARDLLKDLAILWDAIVRRSAVDWEDLKPYRKFLKSHISPGDQQSCH